MLREPPVDVEPRRHNRSLDGVEHVEARFNLAEAVPFVFGLQKPVFALANADVVESVRSPGFEPPVLTEFVVHLRHRATEIERFGNTFFDQRATTRLLHHGRSHVAARDDRVLRTG